ncbi:hypothetical protein Naga_100475g2 [Nannochloropsis gaditana]|uniref:Uncharacterized protein n=1 Tax=Nannochloropsis gaditana TaxID=72520 RepID=W7T9U2_9STRA|nr:hypothetical protein Naga_100475g2 [Nannochloropsis gaditana]
MVTLGKERITEGWDGKASEGGAPELEMEEAKKARERRQDLAIGVGMEEKGTFNCFCHACGAREGGGGLQWWESARLGEDRSDLRSDSRARGRDSVSPSLNTQGRPFYTQRKESLTRRETASSCVNGGRGWRVWWGGGERERKFKDDGSCGRGRKPQQHGF